MTADETPLQIAKRHVRQQKDLIAKQTAIFEALTAAGQSTELAKETLCTMKRTLALALSEVSRHSDRTLPAGQSCRGKVNSIVASAQGRRKLLP